MVINLLGSALSLPADATLTLASRDITLFFATLGVFNGTIDVLGVGPSGSTPLAGVSQTGAAGDFSGSLDGTIAAGTFGAIGNGTAVAAMRTPAIITLRCAA